MFQNDDWEIGEDFLDDFLTEDEPSKKKSDPKKKSSPEKRESDSNNESFSFPPPKEKILESKPERKDSSRRNKILQICAAAKILSSETIQENPEISIQQNSKNENSDNPETSFQQSPKMSRRSKQLEIFKKACNNTSEIKQSVEPKSPEIFKESHNNIESLKERDENSENPLENSKPSRKEARANLINSILKRSKKTESDKKDSPEKEPKTLSRENLVNSILRKSSERSQNSLNATQEIQESEELNISSPQFDNFPKPRRNVSFSNKIDERTERRKKLILDTLKKGSKTSFSKNNESTSSINSRSRNDSKSSTRTTKQVITRKFPGPAGLLPDDLDLSKFPMAYLSSFDESENDIVINESRISNFCSQNTKNLFTGGAWQAMVDDLPPDFLQGHEISTIKYNARKGLYKTDRVPFMAGIVHNVDPNWVENPMILLKDSSDQIEASFHLDIFNMYPNSMEPGAVILFKDVGIIFSRMYLYALIHPGDIVAIYSEKGRIVTTEFMEKILEDEDNKGCEGNKEDSREKESLLSSHLGIDVSFRREERNSSREVGTDNEEERNIEDQVRPENEEISRRDSIENSQPGPSKPRRSATPKPVEIENLTQALNDDDCDDEAFLSINMEEITASQGPKHFASSTLIGSQISLEEGENSPKRRKTSLKERQKTPVKKSRSRKKETPKKPSNVKDYLKQFRNKDDLTQPEVNTDVEEQERNERTDAEKEEGNIPETSNFADLLETDDDFEEEMSQMDVDSVLDKAEEPRKESNKNLSQNPEKGGKPKHPIFEDPVDEMLSQIDMDAFSVDE